jgi:predicted nucleic acid-binding protein
VRPRIDAASAVRMLRTEVLSKCTIRTATCRNHVRILRTMSRRSIGGGIVYDALIAEVGRAARVDRIVTFNVDDFRRVAPDLDVVAP